jgi:hypothetical protein
LDNTSTALLGKCLAAREEGADFPTVWHDILKGHPLVKGLPVQRDGGLEIALITGQRLIYDSDTHDFSIG